MNIEKIKSKFKFHTLDYVLESELGEVVVSNDEVFISMYLDEQQDMLILRYALDDITHLVRYLKQESKTILVPFVDESFVSILEKAGLEVRSVFKDYFKYSFDDVDEHVDFDVLDVSEAQRASMITQNARNSSRGFFGQTTEWFKGWLLGTIDDIKDIGVKHQNILAYREEHKIVGVICIGLYGYEKDSGPILWVRELVVDKKYQGKKIGQKLLKQALSYGKLHHAKKAFLHVDELNLNAIHIYKKHGFIAKDDEGQIDMIYNG
ncbi:MAG: GNAT family N-acetyltransferase [Acholeplasmataceae bacterium]